MAIIRPFRAVRPTAQKASKVAALPYDVMNSDEAREMTKGNPYSFLHVDKAEIDLDPSIDLYDNRVYEKARQNLENLEKDGICLQDEQSSLYIYRQIMGEHVQTGLVACASIDDYLNNVIKKHELTRADKEQDRVRHVDICDANTGPIFLTYRSQAKLDAIIQDWTAQHSPQTNFIAEDGIGHAVWVIDSPAVISELIDLFSDIKDLYIADGHHRAASAVRVGQMRRESSPNDHGEAEFNYFLSVLFPSEQLRIMPYNRVVADLNGMTEQEFLNAIKELFHLSPQSEAFEPTAKHQFGMLLGNQWYRLDAKPEILNDDDPIERLDVTLLQKHVLTPLLAIKDPRTSDRIDFIGGIRGIHELERRVQGGMKIAFSMYATTIDDLMSISDIGEVMPPKSTWFEPKLRSGLFVHKLK